MKATTSRRSKASFLPPRCLIPMLCLFLCFLLGALSCREQGAGDETATETESQAVTDTGVETADDTVGETTGETYAPLTLPPQATDPDPEPDTDPVADPATGSVTEPVTEPEPIPVGETLPISQVGSMSPDTYYENGQALKDGSAQEWLAANRPNGIRDVATVGFRGWAGVPGKTAEAYGYTLDDGQSTVWSADFFIKAEDSLVGATGLPGVTRYLITVEMAEVPTGEHTLHLLLKTTDGSVYELDGWGTLTLVGSEMPTERPTEPATEPETEPATEPTTAEPDPDDPADPHPGDASVWEGLLIDKVYGTGKKNVDAALSHGFIQLYNATAKPMKLDGVSLYYSDGEKSYRALELPQDAVIPAQGCYLIRANSPDGYDESSSVMGLSQYDLEWNIYLDNKELRLLLAPSGWTVEVEDDITSFGDAISVFFASAMVYNDSVYATDDLSKNKVAVRTARETYSGYYTVNLTRADTALLERIVTVTSEGKVNNVLRPRLSEVSFSHAAGLYDASFRLELGAPDGYNIYYTTDGTDPRTSSSRKKVTGAILMTETGEMTWGPMIKTWITLRGSTRPSASTMPGGHVVKAYATNGVDSTAVFTNTYFIGTDLQAYDVPLVSLSIPQEDMLGGNGFYYNYCPTGDITATRPRGTARMEVFDPNGNRVGNSQVELAVSGNGSSGWGMRSLRIYYKSALNKDCGLESDLNYDIFQGLAKDTNGQVITGFSRLLLRNSGNDCNNSFIRDAYMQRACSVLNIDTMASASTLVFVNGEFWGVYNMRERYSPEYVETHYGVNKDNVAIIESDYSQVHTNQNADFVLSSGVEGDQKPFNDVVQFIRTHNLSNQDNFDYVASQFDLDSFTDMWVGRLFFVARDWPENNMKVWRNKDENDPSGVDTKWHFVMLDMDMGLSFYDFTTETENCFWMFDSNSVCGTIMRGLMQNEEYKQRFILRYYEVFTEVFTPEYLSGLFEEMYAERDALMPLQVKRWGNEGASINTWRTAASRIRSFIARRQEIGLTHMYRRFGVSAADMENLAAKKVTFTFADTRVALSCNGETVASGDVLRFDADGGTIRIEAMAREGYRLTSIVWTDSRGTSKTVNIDGEQGSAVFSVNSSGTVSVYAVRTDGETAAGGTLVAGATYLFYLTEDGDLYGWGDNRNGVLGLDPSQTTILKPTLIMQNVARVATSTSCDIENGNFAWMTAILTRDGRLYTVGSNSAGQLGRNGTSSSNVLGVVNFSREIQDISVGHDHLLVLDTSGVLWGVGNNSCGQLNMSGGSTTSFVRVAEGVVQMSAGRRTTLYVDKKGDLYGLGDNRWNKLVAGGASNLTTPTKLRSNVAFVSSGEHQCLVVTESGDLYYAGWRTVNGFGQGGGNSPAFQKLMGGVATASIYHGDMTILCDNGDVYVYGLNTGGCIGGMVTSGKPKLLLSGSTDGVVCAVAGYNFTAYLYEDGSIRVKGDNGYGQSGTGSIGGAASMAAIWIE